jgi:uncharacterized protein YjiS (DUF1127 family)
MTHAIPTQRSWFSGLVERFQAARLARQTRDALRELDARTLADIGIDASEITSIEAESLARAKLTRIRIVGLVPTHG